MKHVAIWTSFGLVGLLLSPIEMWAEGGRLSDPSAGLLEQVAEKSSDRKSVV